jgi:nucleoid-associated protein YgaU
VLSALDLEEEANMGKETKIGLAVIGVLLLGFGGLLVRRVILSDRGGVGDPEAPRATQVLATAADGKPTVVMAQREPVEPQRVPYDRSRPGDLSAESNGDVPRASYLPAESVPTENPQLGRDGDREPAPDDQDAAQPPRHRSGSDPFNRNLPAADGDDREAGTPPNRLEIDTHDATAIEPRVEGPKRGGRNPLRRTSAQVPIDEADPGAAVPSELNADDAQPGQAVITADPPIGEPTVALPRDEDAPAVADDPRLTDNLPDAPDAAAPPRSAWRGTVEPASNNAVEPLTVENGKYTVQPNDSLWTVSEKVYGTGRYFKAIYEHNRARLPHADRLAVGTVIAVPPVALLEQNYPALCPKQRKSALVKPRTIEASTRQRIAGSNVYVVEEGDTLFDIARYELGKASRWAEIYDLNRAALGEDFDYLQPGTELAMPPKSQERDSITRQRDMGIQR